MMRRPLAILVVLGLVVAGGMLTAASGAGDDSARYTLEFDNAFGLVEGGDLKVAGVRAGQTTGFRVNEGADRPTALVEVEITEPGFADFREDARCRIRPQSLIGEYFVDCQPGQAAKRLPEGATLPVEQNEGTIPADLVNNVLRRPYRERLRLILAELGTGLAGRPEDLNEAIRRAHPGLRETNQTLRILAEQNRVIEQFLRDSDTVLVDLEERKEDVARWVEEAGETSELSASRREALAGQFRRLPAFLDELEPTMQRLGRLADEQHPLLRDLQTAAPELETFFAEIGPFAREALPSIRSLGRAAETGREALDESSEEIRELRQLAAYAPRFARPLSNVLQTLEDRNRSVYPDPRAAETDPPAPDPTAGAEGYGFTGFETLLNYPFWQTMAISAFDEVSHMLRVVAHNSKCAPYETGHGVRELLEEDPNFLEDCVAWLGPDQPGVTTPDPTDAAASPAEAEPALDFLLAP